MHGSETNMLKNLPGMIYQGRVVGSDFAITYASPGCEELTGLSPEELVAAGSVAAFVHPEDFAILLHHFNLVMTEGISTEAHVRFVTQGNEKWVQIRNRVITTNSDGIPDLCEGLVTDVSKLLMIETSKLENRDKAGFWARMSHEIRTPMNSIIGMAELGLREVIPDSVRGYMHSIRAAGVSLIDVVNDILDFSRIQGNKLKLSPETYELSALAQEVAQAALPLHKDSGLNFLMYVDSTLPKQLVGDAPRLRRVINALISNGFKFTDSGFVSLCIKGKIVDGGAVNLTVTVQDTGRGIKEEDISDIFEPYAQFDNKNIEGAGLGLAIARHVVQLMGGEISVLSIHGACSSFTFTVQQEIHTEERLCEVNSPETVRVLLIEPLDEAREFISRTLGNLGVEHTACEAVPAEISNFTHVFVAPTLYGTFTTDAEVVLLREPVFCLPVANILNNVAAAKTYFTAPGARVLIVDDISSNLLIAKGLLQPYEMQVDQAESAAKAIALVMEHHYDLILMDHMMPQMDGAEATAKIRQIESAKDTPIVALTANIANITKEMFNENGFDGLLPKPILTVELHAVLEKWIPAKHREAPQTAKAAQETNLTIPGVNVEKGLGMTGGTLENYLQVLREFHANGTRLLPILKDCAGKSDLQLYGIHIHALKGVSASIGATTVSALAATLETAAKRKDTDFIRETNPAFLAAMEALLENIEPALPPGSAPEQVPGAHKKVLIIDDTPSFIVILSNILRDDYEVLASINGTDGIATAQSVMPDLILLDMMMPDIPGLEVLKTLKADEAMNSIPVILITGTEDAADEQRAYSLGATGFIKKPFKSEYVKDCVDAILKC